MERPDLLAVSAQRWSDLIFLHWPVPLARLGPLVPPELTLDTWRGVAYVSLSAMRIQARPFMVPDTFALDTHEVSLRTYVRYRDQPPGIYALSLDVDSWIAVGGARALLGLPCYDAVMRRRDHGAAIELEATRRLGPPARFHVRYLPGKPLGPARPGTLAHFVLERYALYAERSLSLWRAQIRHAPFHVQRAAIELLDTDMLAAATLPQPEHRPRAVHYAASVDVEVFRPELLAVRSPVAPGYALDRGNAGVALGGKAAR